LGAAGDSGMLVTDDGALAEKARALRNHGSEERYLHQDLGYCSRMDELQAMVLRAKLPKLDSWTTRRRAIARAYLDGLAGIEGLVLPPWDKDCVWHQFTVRVAAGKRPGLEKHLAGLGISTAVFYPLPLHQQPAYLKGNLMVPSLPVAEAAAQEVLCLPIYPELSSLQVRRVVQAVARFF
jgi:dTDP-4-amino-4,6-dideoxygalactose transaminase